MSHSSRPPDPYWSDPIPNAPPGDDGAPPSYGGKAGYAPRGTTAYRGRPQAAPVYTAVHPSPKAPNTTVPHRQPGPPSPSEITSLQSRIASMLTDSSSSSEPTSPRRPPPPANRALYHSPPLRRTNPPPSYPPRQVRSQGHDANWDSCEDITTYALNVVRGLQIPEDERLEKEEFCRELERIVKQIRPSANVELFGSFANTFTIANSDIDCCVTDPEATSDDLQSSGLPEKLQAHLDSLGGYETTLLTLTRIPILKLFRPPIVQDPDMPSSGPVYKYPLHCDVGWQNRLALHNTRLLRAYSALDHRLREIVLFVKYWTKTRVISRPRYGTLCSYGYVLMIIYFLMNVVQPPVLPNLQCLPRSGVVRIEDIECEGCNISFSDGNGWKSENSQSIGELIKEFFNHFAFQWHFKNNVVSIRSPTGLLTKESKGWTTLAESTGPQAQTIKSRYLIAIEDPFEITHNVARTVNKQGRLDIRGEFMRAAKMLNSGWMRRQFLGDVCVERVLPERPVSQTEKGGENGEGVQKENEGGG